MNLNKRDSNVPSNITSSLLTYWSWTSDNLLVANDNQLLWNYISRNVTNLIKDITMYTQTLRVFIDIHVLDTDIASLQ